MEYLSAFIYPPHQLASALDKKNCKGLQLVKCASSSKEAEYKGTKLSVLLYCIIFKTTVLRENCVFSLPSHRITCLKISLRKCTRELLSIVVTIFIIIFWIKYPPPFRPFSIAVKKRKRQFHL